jgi:hypothetical protein
MNATWWLLTTGWWGPPPLLQVLEGVEWVDPSHSCLHGDIALSYSTEWMSFDAFDQEDVFGRRSNLTVDSGQCKSCVNTDLI